MHTGRDWNPETHPWRVMRCLRGPSYPCGWLNTVVGCCETLEEAIEVAKVSFPAGCAEAKIHYASNNKEWSHRGWWKLVGTRVRKQEFKFSKSWRGVPA